MDNSIIFEGYESGDRECFVFAVDQKTFKVIKGRLPEDYEKDVNKEYMYQIYPNDLLDKLFSNNKSYDPLLKCNKLKIQISASIIEEGVRTGTI